MNKKLEDDSIMPWGKYEGYLMKNVPANYLIYMYENDKCDQQVKEYVLDNLDFLQMEVKRR